MTLSPVCDPSDPYVPLSPVCDPSDPYVPLSPVCDPSDPYVPLSPVCDPSDPYVPLSPVCDPSALESEREEFNNLILLVGELVQRKMFCYLKYLTKLISRGDLPCSKINITSQQDFTILCKRTWANIKVFKLEFGTEIIRS